MRIAIYTVLFTVFSYGNSVLNLINSVRLKCGASQLQYSYALEKSARKHAIYLNKNREFGHTENRYKDYFYGTEPWNRIVKAGFNTKAVVENISFYERNYKASINKLMATVYHRLAFLDTRIDSIGAAKYGSIYVYDMSNSKLSLACKKEYANSGGYIENICKNSYKTLPVSLFRNILNSTRLKSNSIIVYPYNGAKNIPVKLADERPAFLYKNNIGLPVTAVFNDYYYKNVKLKRFALFEGNKKINCKIVTFRNDMAKKIKKNSFVLVPLKRLKHKTVYKVYLNALADGKSIKRSWSFRTK